MAGERFSREVGKEFHYLARVSESPKYTALIYVVKNVIMGDNAPYGYVLASFDGKGKLIDKMVVGGAKTFDESYKLFTAKTARQFKIEDYKNTYERSTDENGYENNKIISRKLLTTKQFVISADGKFVSAQLS